VVNNAIIFAIMEKEGIYYSEFLADNFFRLFKIDKIYFQGKTKYQQVDCFYNSFLGKVLFLDKKIQSAQIDEHIYHESLVFPALLTHPSPKKALVIGGGEGATLRELLRYCSIEKVTMIDIDKELVSLCQKYMPEWSQGAFDNPKVQVIFGDARSYIEEVEDTFDVIISDLTEPLKHGPSVYLFTKEFFKKVYNTLNTDGIFVLQAGNADHCYNKFLASLIKTLSNLFPIVRPYWTFVPSYSTPWGFIIASKKEDPVELKESKIAQRMNENGVKNLQFYHPGLHRGLFALPLYLQKAIAKARVLSDKKPFIWEM